MARTREPALWALFSGGGMLSALFLPAMVVVLWLAAPLGWVEEPSHSAMRSLFGNLLVRGFLAVLIVLSLFHWAHRFRYTLYDGLQLYHLNPVIAACTYGLATILSAVGVYYVLAL